MNNLLEKFEKKQIENLTSKKRIPTFRPGDTIKVTLKITEGDKSRLQSFEGMCISRKNNSVNSKFTLRKISHGEGVERVFPLFSANINKIDRILGVLEFDGNLDDDIMEMIKEREQARKNKNWDKSDQLRDALSDRGIILEDAPDGTVWKYK